MGKGPSLPDGQHGHRFLHEAPPRKPFLETLSPDHELTDQPVTRIYGRYCSVESKKWNSDKLTLRQEPQECVGDHRVGETRGGIPVTPRLQSRIQIRGGPIRMMMTLD